MNVALISDSPFSPVRLGQESHFLGSTAALERLLRLSENGLAALEVFSDPSHFHGIVKSVH